jgi:cell division transport system ATP-binding protein
MIQLFHVTKTFRRGVEALVDVTLEIKRGELLFLCGDSGAGKTTLLRCLYRDEAPTAGQVLVGGRNLARLGSRGVARLRRSVGLVFQDLKLLRDRTVYENLALVTRVLGWPAPEADRRILGLLKLLALTPRAGLRPADLSGGEQQRVAIARALLNDPQILLADEPAGHLDREHAGDILRLLIELNTKGTTVIVATHDPDLGAEAGGRVVTLKGGRVVSDRPA